MNKINLLKKYAYAYLSKYDSTINNLFMENFIYFRVEQMTLLLNGMPLREQVMMYN